MISEINITPIKPRNGLIGFASFVFDNKFYFSSIGILTKLSGGGGYRLLYPNKHVGDKQINIYHPIDKEVSHQIESAVFTKLQELGCSA